MNIDNFIISNDEHKYICKIILKLLHCKSLWIMKLENDSLSIGATDRLLLDHYLKQTYYLQDPSLETNLDPPQLQWQICLGTEQIALSKNEFFNDLYTIFHITEYVSMRKQIDDTQYCFRFFTSNNRFMLINKLVNDLPIIKYFMDSMVKKSKESLLG